MPILYQLFNHVRVFVFFARAPTEEAILNRSFFIVSAFFARTPTKEALPINFLRVSTLSPNF